MRDVFPQETVEGRIAPEFATNDAEASRIRDGLEAQQVCPFCGFVGDGSASLCPKCAMENNAAARKATKLRIGPWYVLQHRNPAAPGMKWETLLSFVRKGRVKPQSVVRGPTTHQLWRFAAHVKGLSREFGVCYSCGGSMERGGNLCPHCNRLQEPPINSDALLEGSEPESRSPVFREIPTQEVSPAPAAAVELDGEIQEKLRQAEEVLRERREQVETADKLRQELEREREAAVRDREAAQRDREAVAREREAFDRDKEAIERDRLALARERETARRERELRNQSDRPVDVGTRPAPRTETAVWDLSEPEIRPDPVSPPARKPAAAADKISDATTPGIKSRSPRENGFLSAKDLAAAFRLNHQMAIAARERKGTLDEDSAGDEPAARFKSIGAGARRSRRSGGKLFLIFLVLFWVVGAAVVLAYHPAWRAQVAAWWSRVSNGSSSVPTPGAIPPDKTDEPPPPESGPEGLLPTTAPSATRPAQLIASPQTEPAVIALPPPTPAPTTAPGVVRSSAVPAPTPEQPTPVAPVPAPPTPSPQPISPPVSADPEKTAPASAPPAAEITAPPLDPIAQGKLLYRKAIEAEVRNDIPEAVRLYEAIQKLPNDAWPSDLELRLKLDRKQLNQK